MFKKLDALANVAIIVVSLIAAAVLIKNYREPRSVPPPPQVSVGERLSLQNIDWKQHHRTLVLALQTSCHFCSESASFYQQLASVLPPAGVHMTAVLPQPTAASAEYLKSLHVNLADVRQGSFAELKIRGTPTLMFVDEQGVVRNVWVGKLPLEKERELIDVVLAGRGD